MRPDVAPRRRSTPTSPSTEMPNSDGIGREHVEQQVGAGRDRADGVLAGIRVLGQAVVLQHEHVVGDDDAVEAELLAQDRGATPARAKPGRHRPRGTRDARSSRARRPRRCPPRTGSPVPRATRRSRAAPSGRSTCESPGAAPWPGKCLSVLATTPRSPATAAATRSAAACGSVPSTRPVDERGRVRRDIRDDAEVHVRRRRRGERRRTGREGVAARHRRLRPAGRSAPAAPSHGRRCTSPPSSSMPMSSGRLGVGLHGRGERRELGGRRRARCRP